MIFTGRLVILIILSAVLISLGSLYSFFLYFGIPVSYTHLTLPTSDLV